MLCPQTHIHFVGIGGAGMSAIAKVLLELNYRVSGSDLKVSPATRRLEKMGATISIGHSRKNLQEPDLLVVSSAVPENNVEVAAAREDNIPVLQRGEMLARLMAAKKGIGVAGSHGKTTTTSMISLLLEKTGLDPTVLIGGELNDIGGNAKLGQGVFLVAEADESDGSFLMLKPEIAVITNIEDDHLDYYGSIQQIVEAFFKYVSQIRTGGLAIICSDSPWAEKIAEKAQVRVISYGITGEAQLMARDISPRGLGTRSRIFFQEQELGQLDLSVPGEHNVANALAAVAVGLEVGLSFPDIARALGTFRGVHRRFELKGEINGISVVDDYGHHPTEIRATIKAARQGEFNRIIAVFQPHRFTRTKFLLEEFARSFGEADEVVISDIYSAGETPLPGVSAGALVERVKEAGQRQVTYIPSLEDIPAYLESIVQKDDLVLTIGAGDVWKVGEKLLKGLCHQEKVAE